MGISDDYVGKGECTDVGSPKGWTIVGYYGYCLTLISSSLDNNPDFVQVTTLDLTACMG